MAIAPEFAGWVAATEPAVLRAAAGLVWDSVSTDQVLQHLHVAPRHRERDGRVSIGALAFLVDSTLGTAAAVGGRFEAGITTALRLDLSRPVLAAHTVALEARLPVVTDGLVTLVAGTMREGDQEVGSASVRMMARPLPPAGRTGAGLDGFALEIEDIDDMLGVRSHAIEPDGHRVAAVASPALGNRAGILYGGAVAALAQRGARSAADGAAGGRPTHDLSLAVDYLRPAPLGAPLEVRSRVVNISRQFVWTDADVWFDGKVVARARALGAIEQVGISTLPR